MTSAATDDSKQISITYRAEPTASMFHHSPATVRGFMGPIGNGKTVACITELHRLATTQQPNNQGVRKTRWAIIRNTYPELRTTTLKTFKQWIPETICKITLHPMITAFLAYQLPDKTIVEAEFLFIALDKDDDVKKLLSLELTGAYINEAKEVPYSIVTAARGRIGRYPAHVDGYPKGSEPCTRKALLMDTNPPDDDHWWYQLAEEGSLRTNQSPEARKAVSEIFEFFRGVPPLIKTADGYEDNPFAENIQHLPGGYAYYRDLIAGNSEDFVEVMILGNYGQIREGMPVYPEYNDRIHSAKDTLKIIKNLPVGIGMDFGLTPCAVFGQLTQGGQLRVIHELQADQMGVREFARDVLLPFVRKNFYDMEILFCYGDPSGNARGEGDGKSAIGILNDDYAEDEDYTIPPLNLPFVVEPAPSNDPTKRIDAVRAFLTKMVGCGEPGYILSKSCKNLRKGKIGGYHYKKVQSANGQYMKKPNKNQYSHTADAEQYLALGFIGFGVEKEEDFNEKSYRHRYNNFENSMGY